jgi:hypothetical protein
MCINVILADEIALSIDTCLTSLLAAKALAPQRGEAHVL